MCRENLCRDGPAIDVDEACITKIDPALGLSVDNGDTLRAPLPEDVEKEHSH